MAAQGKIAGAGSAVTQGGVAVQEQNVTLCGAVITRKEVVLKLTGR